MRASIFFRRPENLAQGDVLGQHATDRLDRIVDDLHEPARGRPRPDRFTDIQDRTVFRGADRRNRVHTESRLPEALAGP